MGGFSNFAISFSIISILTGAVTLYGYGLEMGGPLQMSLGWPAATVFTLTVAMAMAEMCSAWPTSGAMYHWAAALGGPFAGWLVAWLNIFGLTAMLAGIDYSCAQFAMPFLGAERGTGWLFALFAAIAVSQAVLNHYGVRLVARFNDLSVAVHILGVFAILGALLWFAPLRPVSFLAEAVNSNGRTPYWWAFLLGMLQAQWTFTGFDASAHMAEETENPRIRAPWGIVLSVAVSGVVGYLLLLALTLAIGDMNAVLASKDSVPPAIAILRSALGERIGSAMGGVAAVAMWFCGLSSLTSASRAVYSLARDGGTPAAAWLRRVDPRHGCPARAVWAVAAASVAAMAWTGAVPVVTSFSTVALYLAYGVPIVLGLRRREWLDAAEWRLGAASRPVHGLAAAYSAAACVVLVMPPNELAGMTLAASMAGLLAIWFGGVRSRYAGPEWARRV